MIGIGINQNVYITKAERTEKGALALSFANQEEKKGFFDRMNEQGMADEGGDTRIMLFPLNVPASTKNPMTTSQKVEMIQSDITRRRNQLIHILLQYMTSDKAVLDITANTGITSDTKPNEIEGIMMDQQILDKISDNLFNGFIELITPHLNDTSKRFRLKLQRTSKEKGFPTLPDRYLKERPFMEPMEIPEDSSQVKFSEWEIKEGLNDPTPPSRSGADKPGESAPANGAAPTAASVFGQR